MAETIIWIVTAIFVTAYIIIEIEGDISWKLYTKPAVFGKDVQLSCHLTNTTPCCNRYTRKWAKGWKYNLAIINGVSLNILKYTECVIESANTSIFTIKTLNEDDVNIPYECTYGFNTFSTVLEMTEEDFEYHPIEELPGNITYYKDYIEANILMEKVYPSPKCNATDGMLDLKENLTITNVRKGLFYTSNMSLVYKIIDTCSWNRTIEVICIVGHTSFSVVNYTVPCLEEKPKYPKKKKTEFVFVAIATFIFCAGLVGIIALSLILMREHFATIDQSRDSPSEAFLATAETEL